MRPHRFTVQASSIPSHYRVGSDSYTTMATVELHLFTVTDPLTGARRRTTYRLTVEEARERYVDPEVLPWSLEVREVQREDAPGHGQHLGDATKR